MCGCAKPVTKDASFCNLLRGAGIAEIDKNKQKVDELERKVNELIAAQGGTKPAVTNIMVGSQPQAASNQVAPTPGGVPLPAAAQLHPPPLEQQQMSPPQPLEQDGGGGGCNCM